MSRAFDFALAGSQGVKVLPDLSTLPSVGDVVAAGSIVNNDVFLKFNPPSGAGVFLPLTGGTVTGQLAVSQSTTGNFPTAFLTHGGLYGTPQQSNTNFTQIALDEDVADAAASGGPGGVNYLYVGGVMNAGWTGNRSGVNAFMYVNGTPGAHASSDFVTGLVGWSQAHVPDNGKNNTIMAGNVLAKLGTGATNWGGLVGLEVDILAQSGTSVNLKEAFKVVIGCDDVVQGTSADFGMAIVMEAGSPGTGGFKTGFSFGSATGVWPFQAGGTLIGTTPTALGGRSYAAGYGVDFSAVSFGQAAFRSVGFLVNGAGAVSGAGFSCGSTAASSSTDLSKHVALYSSNFGFNVSSGQLNAVLGGGAVFTWNIGGAVVGTVDANGINISIGATTPTAGRFTSLAASSAQLSGGLSFGTRQTASATDVTQHISLFDGFGGFSVSGGYINVVANNTVVAQTAGVSWLFPPGIPVIVQGQFGIGGIGSGPTWTTGSAAPSTTQPIGSIYSRVGGAVGATLYVSRGGGTWAAVAGV